MSCAGAAETKRVDSATAEMAVVASLENMVVEVLLVEMLELTM